MTKLQLQAILLSKKSDLLQSQLATAYIRSSKNIISEAENLYLEMLDEGEVSYTKLMQYDRYYKLLGNINQELKKLGHKEIKILDAGMIDLYLRTGELVSGNGSWAILNKGLAEETIKRAWCADGKTYSDRIWKQKDELQSKLQTGLMDAVIQGKSHKVLVKDLKNSFNVAESDADRIARTELNYVQNQAAMRGYMDAGYDMYEFISSIDDRTCDECADLDGQVFYFSEAEEGVNFPPIHPNCRSNIIGYKG